MLLHQRTQHLNYLFRGHAAIHPNRQTFTGPLIHDGEQFQLLPVRTPIIEKIIRPHLVRVCWCQWSLSISTYPSAALALRYVQACTTPHAVHALDIDHVTVRPHQRPGASIAIARIALGNTLELLA